jgi:hypothetical protein
MDNIHRYLGIELNRQTWFLLDKKDHDKLENQRTVAFAHSSLYHWQHSHEFLAVNKQRGEWLISHVYAALGQGSEALKHTRCCLKITEDQDLKDFDLAYAYDVMARGHTSTGETEEMNKYFLKAKKAAAEIKAEKDRNLFLSDLHAESWFKCIA